jgi:hypothetical protein
MIDTIFTRDSYVRKGEKQAKTHAFSQGDKKYE